MPAVTREWTESKEARGAAFDESAMSLHEFARLSQAKVIQKKLGMRDGIAIQKNNIIAVRPGDCLVQDARSAKALFLLPDVLDAEALLLAPVLDCAAGFLSRSVVSDE